MNKIFKLKNAVQMKYIDSKKICSVSFGTTSFEIEDPNRYYFNLMKTREFIKDNVDEDLFNFLFENHLLVSKYTVIDIPQIYSRNIPFFENLMNNKVSSPYQLLKKLNSSKICIIGCGGVGSIVFKNLLASGVGNFILVDGDNVEINNLNRQVFFNINDVNKEKVKILKDAAVVDYPNVQIEIINQFIESENDIKQIVNNNDIDLIVNCADNPNNIVEIIASVGLKMNIPTVSSGVGIKTGYWGPFYDDYNLPEFNEIKMTSFISMDASFSPTNMLISSYLAYDITLYLLRHQINIDFNNFYKEKELEFDEYRLEKR